MAMIAPTVDSVGDAALTNSIIDRSITELQDNIVASLTNYALYGCTALKKVAFGEVTDVSDGAFSGCTALEVADFHKTVTITGGAFTNCTALKALILRSTEKCTITSSAGLGSTGISAGTGYIYVPSALVDTYKADSKWGTYAAQIRAIEDYPEVCSTAGKAWVLAHAHANEGKVTHANGLWLTDGYFYYSYDGKTWQRHPATLSGVSCVAFGGGRWVLLSPNNSLKPIQYSDDGLNWAVANCADASSLTTLCYAGGVWFASSGSAAKGLYYSSDGITFQKSGIADGYYIDICYANGLWVMGGSYTTSGLFYSTDGVNWTQSNITSIRISKIAYNNGVWVAGTSSGSSNYYSADGIAWTKCSGLSTTVKNFAYHNGMWVASTGKGLYYSNDGAAWTKSNSASVSFNFVEYANGLFVAGNDSTGLCYSQDGITWTQSDPTPTSAKGAAFADGVWVTVGGEGIYYSE